MSLRALPLILIASTAFAQDFELDLTEEKPVVPVELRPTLAVLSVKSADGEDMSASRAKQLEAEFLKQLGAGDAFQTVIEPSGAKISLGAEFAKYDACIDYACFEAAAKALKVHRVVRLTVQKQGVGSLATMYGFDPGLNEVLVVGQDSGEKAEKAFLGVSGKSQSQKDKEFMKKMIPFLGQVQKALSTPNGKIIIDNDPSALATVDGVEAGIGSSEFVAQRGRRTVKATSAGYKPFEETVTVEPGKTVEVKVQLVAIPIEQVAIKKPVAEPKDSFFARPGLYIALAGAIAAGVGIGFGQAAQSVQNKLSTNDDPVGVTRAEAKAAPTNALIANILVAAGSAAVVGGVTWIILTPTAAPPAPAIKPGTIEPVESQQPGPTGAMLNFGGSF